MPPRPVKQMRFYRSWNPERRTMMRSNRDAVVVITGASSGIGRAAAHAFAAAGASVVLAARAERPLQEAARECIEAGGQSLAVPTDVTSEAAAKALAQRAIGAFGRTDVWVHNATVSLFRRSADTPLEASQQLGRAQCRPRARQSVET